MLILSEGNYFIVSSVQIPSQRLKDNIFLRIPLNVFGGIGKFGREKFSTSIIRNPWICSRDISSSSSLTSANDSANYKYFFCQKLPCDISFEVKPRYLVAIPANMFPPIWIYSSMSFRKLQLLGCFTRGRRHLELIYQNSRDN